MGQFEGEFPPFLCGFQGIPRRRCTDCAGLPLEPADKWVVRMAALARTALKRNEKGAGNHQCTRKVREIYLLTC